MGSVIGRTHVHRGTGSVDPESSCGVQVFLNWATAPKSCFRRGPDITVKDTPHLSREIGRPTCQMAVKQTR